MHVVQLQTHSPKAPPKSSNTGHAYVAATAKMPTVAEAVDITEQLRMSQEAANLQVQTAVSTSHTAFTCAAELLPKLLLQATQHVGCDRSRSQTGHVTAHHCLSVASVDMLDHCSVTACEFTMMRRRRIAALAVNKRTEIDVT